MSRFLPLAVGIWLGQAGLPLEARATDFFVSPTGGDTNPGTLERPFATLERAQQAARQVQRREAVTVNLRAGVYYLPSTLVFTSDDSGTRNAPVTYQAYSGEQAVISSGSRLTNLTWEPYRAGIMRATVPAGFATDQLFVNGERQSMARYPNFDPNVRHFNGYAADAISPERAADILLESAGGAKEHDVWTLVEPQEAQRAITQHMIQERRRVRHL